MNRKDLPLRKLLELRNAWVAWLVFFVAIAVTATLWQVSIRLVEDRTKARFRTQSLQLKTAIEERLLNYEQVLAGSAGLFAVAGDVSRDEWREYIDKVDINRYYPGIQGIGYVRRIGVRQMADHISSVRGEGVHDWYVPWEPVPITIRWSTWSQGPSVIAGPWAMTPSATRFIARRWKRLETKPYRP